MRQAIGRASRNQQGIAILALDLDGFQMINDSLGHECGDKLLWEIGQRLLLSVMEGVTVARISGDEFVVMLESNNPIKEVTEIAQCLLDSIREPIMLENHEISVTVSIGISVYPSDGKGLTIIKKRRHRHVTG